MATFLQNQQEFDALSSPTRVSIDYTKLNPNFIQGAPALPGAGISGIPGINGIANSVASLLGNTLAGKNSTGIGSAMQSIGSLASNIPGVGGIIGAGANLAGGLINAAFGSHINKDFVNSENKEAAIQGSTISNANTNESLMSDWSNLQDLSNVTKHQVGSDGWFSHKARNKTRNLNNAIDNSNERAYQSLTNADANIGNNTMFNAMSNYYAYGGQLGKGNSYGWGGAVNIAKGLIKKNEGWRDHTYQNRGDVPTIGWGFTDMGFRSKYKEGINRHYKGKMTPKQAETELGWFLSRAANNLEKIYGDNLSDTQKAAILDTYYQRPGTVSKNSAFYRSLKNGNNNASNYLSVPGSSNRNIIRQSLFNNMNISTPSYYTNPVDNTRVQKPVIPDTSQNELHPVTNNIPQLPAFNDILASIRQPQTLQQEEQPATIDSIMNSYNNMYNASGNDTVLKDGGPVNTFAKGGTMIAKNKRGTFKAQASRMGMSVQEAANKILGAKEGTYSPAMRKKANFARNFAHADGGPLMGITSLFANGGPTDSGFATQGSIFDNKVDFVNQGGTHEQNPNGGIPVGTGQNGEPNLVEQGEVIWNGNYVFSNRLKVPKVVADRLHVSGTFADAAKKLSKESDERPNDPIAERTMNVNMGMLSDAQEIIRQQKEENQKVNKINSAKNSINTNTNTNVQTTPDNVNTNSHKFGGKFANGGTTILPDVNVNALYNNKYRLFPQTPYNPLSIPDTITGAPGVPESPRQQSTPQSIPQNLKPAKQVNQSELPTYMRYAPVAGSAINAFMNILSSPDYGNADTIENAAAIAGKQSSIPVSTINDKVKGSTYDPYYMVNMGNQNLAASNRNAMDISGGNRAQALAGILSGTYNMQKNLAETARQAYLANRQNELQTAEFNRGTNQYNASAENQRNQAQEQLNKAGNEAFLNGMARAATMKQALNDQRSAAFSQNQSNLYSALGNIGWENQQRNWLNALAKAGVLKAMLSGNGDIEFSKKN